MKAYGWRFIPREVRSQVKKKEDILSKCRWRMRESEVSPDHFSLKIFGYRAQYNDKQRHRSGS